MIIDLNILNYEDEIIVDTSLDYNDSYISNSDILELKSVKVIGNIKKDYEEKIIFNVSVEGDMILEDAITLEKVPYHFTLEIDENLEKSLKSLDLNEFLWHYIVLEIPIRYTTSNVSKLRDVYKDIYEEEEFEKINNPFKDFFKE